MANPYPANFETLQGSRRLTGQVNFTDPANQPDGGSQTLAQVLAAGDDANQEAIINLHGISTTNDPLGTQGSGFLALQGTDPGKLLLRLQDGMAGTNNFYLADGADGTVFFYEAGGDGSGFDQVLYVLSNNAGTAPLAGASLSIFGGTGAGQHTAIPNASGGAIVDTEARAALNALLAAFRAWGFVAS